MSSFSCILPAYNEPNLALAAVEKTVAAFESISALDYEIIVVDDGSKNPIRSKLEPILNSNKKVKLIENYINLNQGVSILRGFLVAEKEFLIHNGVDLPLNPKLIPSLIHQCKEVDLLVIQRTRYAGASLWRRFASKNNNLLRKILFPKLSKNIDDMNYTQIYRRDILNQILPLSRSPAFTTQELIMRAVNQNLRVKTTEADQEIRTEGKGAFGKPHDILWSFYDMLRFRIRLL